VYQASSDLRLLDERSPISSHFIPIAGVEYAQTCRIKTPMCSTLALDEKLSPSILAKRSEPLLNLDLANLL